jgi:hypothetical protein
LTGKPQSRITPEHPVVLGQHLGIEDLDAHLVGGLGELAQQHRAQPLALHRVGDLQSDLGPLRPVGLTFPASMADYLTRVPQFGLAHSPRIWGVTCGKARAPTRPACI